MDATLSLVRPRIDASGALLEGISLCGELKPIQTVEEIAERGLMVNLHCDESDDPLSRHIETLVYETQRLGLRGRVCGSHLTSMRSMDNYYVSKLTPLMVEVDGHAIPNPAIYIMLQGRHDS